MPEEQSKRKHLVILQPSGSRGEIEEGMTLMDAAQQLGVGVRSICGGQSTCNKCRVEIQEGHFERLGIESRLAHLSPMGKAEHHRLSPFLEKSPASRQACQARILGPVVAFVPEESRANRQVIRKGTRELEVQIKPAIRKYFVRMEAPSLEAPLADWERLQQTLLEQHGIEGLQLNYHAMLTMPVTLRQENWEVTVSVWQGQEIIRVEPGFVDISVGIAIDIGTTTIAAYLVDLATGEVLATEALMNPQVSFGDDVMSRITYALRHDEGLQRLHVELIGGLNTVIERITAKAGYMPEDVLEMVLVGNTTMHHLLLNISPQYMGLSPFTPALHHSVDIKAHELKLCVHPAANIHILPVVAGFLGADTVGCIIAEQYHKQDRQLLLLDIGTNGEMVLGNRERLFAASCATGPAFEGAQITYGMRAAEGAIEKIEIDPLSWEVRYKVIGQDEWSDSAEGNISRPRGICGSAIVDLGWELFKAGIINQNGHFNSSAQSPRLRKLENGYEFVLVWAEETAIERDITFSTDDVRALQLAKSAMYCAAKIMMRHLGVEKLERVALAGAFGNYIDKVKAMAGGLFPDCNLKNVYPIGNAAGDGARLCLLNTDLRHEANRVVREIEYLELTEEADFDRLFADAMSFPHARDEFPHLAPLLQKARRERYERLLGTVAPFDQLSSALLRQVAAEMQEMLRRRRQVVIEAGNAGSGANDVLLVAEGQLHLFGEDKAVLAEYGAGQWVILSQVLEHYPAGRKLISGSRLARVLVIPETALERLPLQALLNG